MSKVAVLACFLALGACSTLSGRVVAGCPAELLQPLPKPVLEGRLNADLARAYSDLTHALHVG